jgi:uncharacterized protein involved in response to NO
MKFLYNFYIHIFDSKADAHRLFFPLALTGALSGVALWIYPGPSYAMKWHREVMICLFLIPAACGFSFIALPRFLGSFPTTLTDKLVMFALWIIEAAVVLLDLFTPFLFAKLASLLYLTYYVIIRVIRREGLIPIFFVFLPVSLWSGLTGIIAQMAGHFDLLDRSYSETYASNAYFFGMFLLLVSGMGIKLFPIFTQTPPTGPAIFSGSWNRTLLSSRWFWLSVALTLYLSLALPSVYDSPLFGTVRFAILILIASRGWLLFQRGMRGGYLNLFLRSGVILGIGGEALAPILPGTWVHARHLVFIGALGVPVFAVMTRVILAHEGRPFDAEQRSPWIIVIFMMILMAAMVRFAAAYREEYFDYLRVAAALWSMGGVFWAIFILNELRLKRRMV